MARGAHGAWRVAAWRVAIEWPVATQPPIALAAATLAVAAATLTEGRHR